ncbi:MAG: phosphoenolpyruvate carboxylase [Chitinophagaceae bacterium]
MTSFSSNELAKFTKEVGVRYQLYNSLFTSLPFHRIEKTGILLSLLQSNCEDGYKKRMNPSQILEDFFSRHTAYGSEQQQLDLLFRFVQYVERQVVLFDALEDAAFPKLNDMNGVGTLKHLETEVIQTKRQTQLQKKLKDFCVRLVLTAHPTQFYPDSVLGIINDLSKAIAENNLNQINIYLQQLGKTAFFKKQKPTPYDEAVSLIWYLENVFYQASGRIANTLMAQYPDLYDAENKVIRMGFWPGGDRDGNPFVTSEITAKVAKALRGSIIKCYYLDIRKLKRRLTFEGVEAKLTELEVKLYNNIFIPGHQADVTKDEIIETLNSIREIILYNHNGLFLNLVDGLINRVQLFGLYFASLDIRQDSSVHAKVIAEICTVLKMGDYESMTDEAKIEWLSSISTSIELPETSSTITKDTLQAVKTIKQIQEENGRPGCERYIISQCNSAVDILEVFALFVLGGWKRESISVDIIPLFETIGDLANAAHVMQLLYSFPLYKEHLKRRGNKQTVMLGFSDGTKDGGYLMANYSIFKAKKELTSISAKYDIDVVFFDGRGGPPARGGGKTHKFYASMGGDIANKEIELTVQGQTVSSNFGTVDAAQFNIEQLIHAGLGNELFSDGLSTFSQQEQELLQQLSEESFKSYASLKSHPYFLDYLYHASPLRFYAETNIGSRPAKRGASSSLSLQDLRAIPFVGAWSQMKQNVTGYYGVGTALKIMEERGVFQDLKNLYSRSSFFKTLIDNCEMAMKKCYFPLTAFLSDHPKYGELWRNIEEEFELTKKYILLLSGKTELMSDYPIEQVSIQTRERIVLPIATIQQYAITKVREMDEKNIPSELRKSYEKLVMRCSFGIINAGRNSA